MQRGHLPSSRSSTFSACAIVSPLLFHAQIERNHMKPQSFRKSSAEEKQQLPRSLPHAYARVSVHMLKQIISCYYFGLRANNRRSNKLAPQAAAMHFAASAKLLFAGKIVFPTSTKSRNSGSEVSVSLIQHLIEFTLLNDVGLAAPNSQGRERSTRTTHKTCNNTHHFVKPLLCVNASVARPLRASERPLFENND